MGLREEFYGELNKLAESNPSLKRLIEETEAEYPVDTTLEEEDVERQKKTTRGGYCSLL